MDKREAVQDLTERRAADWIQPANSEEISIHPPAAATPRKKQHVQRGGRTHGPSHGGLERLPETSRHFEFPLCVDIPGESLSLAATHCCACFCRGRERLLSSWPKIA